MARRHLTLAELLERRRRGQRPPGPVLLSVSGPLTGLPDWLTQAHLDRHPDLRGCMGLDVIIAYDGSGAKAAEVIDLLTDLLNLPEPPRGLEAWNVPEGFAVCFREEGEPCAHRVPPTALYADWTDEQPDLPGPARSEFLTAERVSARPLPAAWCRPVGYYGHG